MSVSLYSIYAQSCTNLAKSIIIKSEATARAINEHSRLMEAIYRLDYHDENNPHTWRYYMNLAGQYHPLDLMDNNGVPIRVISIDTITEIDFTIENLKEHRATWREYQKGSTYYRKLVDKYPKLTKLIDGILNPIDINKAIQARDNEILYYNKDLVESNEYSLMLNLQKRIDYYFDRYDNTDYEKTDNLYIPAKIGIFYLYLPYIIQQLRFEKARTIEAHSFHVWAYLGSHQYLDDYRDHLNLYQRMWFYRNIRWVESNPGKTSTFEKLIDVIMTNRRLPIAEYDTRQITTEIVDNKEVFYPEVVMNRNPLNLQDIITKEGSVRTIDEIVEKEVGEARDNKHYIEEDKHYAKKTLTRSPDKSLSSKVLESIAIDNTKRQPVRKIDVELNEWIYMTTQGLYRANISVSNPKTADIMNISQDEALILFVYSLMKGHGVDVTLIPTVTAKNVLRRNKPTLQHARTLIDERITNPLYCYAAHDIAPTVESIISTSRFADFCNDIYQAKLKHRNLYSFIEDAREHIQVKAMTDQFYESVVCKLTDKKMSFMEYFKAKGFAIENLTRSEYTRLANEITTKALGGDLVKKYSLREVQGMMVRLLKQLSSYSIQFLKSINEDEIIVIDWAYLRYHSHGFRSKSLFNTYTTKLNIYNLTNVVYHKELEPAMTFPLKGSNLKAKTFHLWELKDKSDIDKSDQNAEGLTNLILDVRPSSKLQTRSRFRMPSSQFKLVNTVIHPPKPTPENINPWEMDKFKIHNTTEERSRVVYDDENEELIVRGVVYVKEDYEGK